MVGQLAGKPIKTRAAGLGMLRVIGLFQPIMRELVEMNYLLTDPFIMDDSALRALLGNVKTPLEEGLRQSLEAARRK
jgi:hypothetical protein